MTDSVLYDKHDRIAYVTLNRPEAKNAIDPPMHDELCRIWADFRDDEAVDVAILTGASDAFCAGADLKTFVPPTTSTPPPSRVREIVDPGSAA
jgi:enoyl-CoA hydratase/carnithine racemase